ncbi:MAG: T9SS type A sorting domain-containing protein [Bacteroidetes bacterium]|nr:T9SS type A sorting domain-containing protein [Bacteroidota bacterium]
MEKAWPMKTGQAQFTVAPRVADFSYMGFPDTLLQETWQSYLVKAYKQMRIADPAKDRYLMSVQPGWFGNRLDKEDFNHRASQTLNWSGIWDFAVASADHWKHGVHVLGHSFGLRRGDLDPGNADQREQYHDYFIGISIEDALDVPAERIIRDRVYNKVSRPMNTRCFMGGSQVPASGTGGFDYYLWISKIDYERLLGSFESFTASRKEFSKTGTVEKALFIEGSVDSTSRMFSFGPWMRLGNATPSSMMDENYASHIFKVLDASNQELARYLYHPTFRAQGLDEVDALTAPDPHMETEHFAFVVPCPDAARRVVVERDGNIVAERVLSQNKPVVSIDFPANNQDVKVERFLAQWSATDPDGDTDFWYTAWLSTDNGMTWTTIVFETKAQQDSIFGAANKSGYRLRVVANDGVNFSDTVEVAFSILTSTKRIPTATAFELKQNYPNPFNPSTTISFTLPASGEVSLLVYDALGRPVETLIEGYRSAGTHHVGFDASGLSSGTYLAVLRSNGKTASIRMTLAR